MRVLPVQYTPTSSRQIEKRVNDIGKDSAHLEYYRGVLQAPLNIADQFLDHTGANLSDAALDGANLTGAHLNNAIISQIQLDKACGAEAMLPPGLTLKPCASPK